MNVSGSALTLTGPSTVAEGARTIKSFVSPTVPQVRLQPNHRLVGHSHSNAEVFWADTHTKWFPTLLAVRQAEPGVEWHNPLERGETWY